MHTRVAPKRTSSAAGIRVTEREGLGRGRGLLGGEGGVFYAVNFVLSVTAAVWKSACGTRATAEKARPVVYNDEHVRRKQSRRPLECIPLLLALRHGCDGRRFGGLHHPLHARLQVPLAHGERASARQRL